MKSAVLKVRKYLRLKNLDAFDIKKKLNDKHKVVEDKTLAAV